MSDEQKIKELERRVVELERLTKPLGGGFNQELFDGAIEEYEKNPPEITPADKGDYEKFGLKWPEIESKK